MCPTSTEPEFEFLRRVEEAAAAWPLRLDRAVRPVMEVAKAILHVAAEVNGGSLPEMPITFGKSEVTKLERRFVAKYGFGFFRWLVLDTFNLVVRSLPNRDVFVSPYIQIPPQVQRQLVLEASENLGLIGIVGPTDQYFTKGWLAPLPKDMAAQADVVVWDFLMALARYSHFVPPNWIATFASLLTVDASHWYLNASIGEDQTDGPPAYLRVFLNDLVKFFWLRMLRFFNAQGNVILESDEPYPNDKFLLPRRYRNSEALRKAFDTWQRRALPGHTPSPREMQYALQIWAKLNMPIFLASAYTGEFKCASLPQSSFWLLFPAMSPPQPPQPEMTPSQAQSRADDLPGLGEGFQKIVTRLRKAFIKIRNERKAMRGTSDVRKAAIKALVKLGGELEEASNYPPAVRPYLHNLELFCRFAITLWSSSSFSPKTIRDYLTKLDTHLLRVVGGARLEDLSPVEATERFAAVASQYSNRDGIQPLRLLENFLRQEPPNGLGRELGVNWRHRGFFFRKTHHAHHLVGKDQFDQVLEMLSPRRASHILRAAAILSYFAGLRANEVAKLQYWNWRIGAREVSLWVEHSKTPNGRRNLPLHLLVPPKYREEILSLLPPNYRNNPDKYYCVKPDGEVPYSSEHLRKEISNCLKAIVAKDASHHTLRASFINITFLRLLCVAWGKNFLGHEPPLFADPRFWKNGLVKARWLLDGSGDLREGSYTLASRVTAALALLSGHGSRKVTFENYIHVHDWIHRSFVSSASTPTLPRLSKARLAAACFSYPRQVSASLPDGQPTYHGWRDLVRLMEALQRGKAAHLSE